MAEFVLKDLLEKAGRNDVSVESAALHTDEIGSDTHYGTKRELARHGVPFAPCRAELLSASRASGYDMIIGMDRANMADLRRLLGPAGMARCRKLLDFADVDRDVADPWYTGDFEATYSDVIAGCEALLRQLPPSP